MDHENSSEEAKKHAEISTKFQSSKEQNREVDNSFGIVRKQLSFEKNNMEADVSPGRNNMENDLAFGRNNMENEVLSGKSMEADLSSGKNDMETDVASGKNNMEDEVLSGKKNMEADVSSRKNNIETDLASGKNNMEDEDQVEASSKLEPPKKKTTKKLRARRKIVKSKAGGNTGTFSKLQSSEELSGEAVNPPIASTRQLAFGKNNMDAEVLPGKNNVEDENQGQASSKLKSPMKKITKKLRPSRKLVKKYDEAGGSGETFSKLQSSELPSGKAMNPPKASPKQILFQKNNMETEVLPVKNDVDVGNQGEASSKLELSTKKTSKMLKARPKIVKKSMANESLKANMANGTSKVQWRNKRKNKKDSREETTEKNVNDKVLNEGKLENKNKGRVRGSDKSQQNQSVGKYCGSDKSSRQKDKEKCDDIQKSQQNELMSDNLGGMIFMCSAKTKPDCFRYHLMGVSMNKKDLVLSIKPGLKLFLYDFDLKLLYGIYKASSPGGVNIEHRAFGGAFPVQVRFDIHKDCFPLPERVFRKAIKENYNEKRKFKTELTVKQVRKLSELFKTLPGGPGHTPAMPAAQDGESYVRVRESRPPSSRERVGRDPYVNDNDRSYPILPREGREHIAYKEIMPQRREDISRDIYLSEIEYRAYGLQGERRNLTPPRHAPPSHHAAPSLDPYERDHAREKLIRQPDVTYRDTVSVHRESSRIDPLYLTGAPPVHPTATVTATAAGTVLDHYRRDPYHPYNYGVSAVDSYRPPVHRDEVSSAAYSIGGRIENNTGEMDPLRRREPVQADMLYPSYATDALSSYNRMPHYQGVPRETALAPVSSRYSFAGPSLSYR